MIKKITLLLLLLLILPGLVLSGSQLPDRCKMKAVPFRDTPIPPGQVKAVFPPYPIEEIDGVDEIGDTMSVGTSWYDYQHNGNVGRMIVLDDQGYIHVVWMNGLNSGGDPRHVSYNYITPQGAVGQSGGFQVDGSTRAGFTDVAVGSDGRAFVTFHQIQGGSANPHSAVAVDFSPHLGAFLTFEIPWLNGEDLVFIWPKMAMMQNGQILVINTENATELRRTWTVGTYDSGSMQMTYTPQELLESTTLISTEVGASRYSNRVGAAWAALAPTGSSNASNSDLHAMVDDDGLDLNFNNWWNVTNFLAPDYSWPDTLHMDGDTMRVHADQSMLWDTNNVLHIAFATSAFYQLEDQALVLGWIWHWSEASPNEYQMIADGFYEPSGYVGNYASNVDCPSLGQDPVTGNLYCTYRMFDTTTVSAQDRESGEICISVSTDGGMNWSVGTNVTNTMSPDSALPGECLSEGWPSMAERVNGFCHILYVLDRDAGASWVPEGSWTLNDMIYHKVPVNLIPTTPLMPQWPYDPGAMPFHVQHLTQPLGTNPGATSVPAQFALEQNAPNPFNPTTTIRFSLESLSNVDLAVYNLRGEMVAKVARGVFQAGTHTVGFDGSSLASGVYLYRLKADGKTLQRKMVLIK